MVGLIDYGSSDEETEVAEQMTTKPDETKEQHASRTRSEITPKDKSERQKLILKDGATPDIEQPPRTQSQDTAIDGPILGPSLGPASGPLESQQVSTSEAPSPSSSPYITSRQIIHSLTLPPVPNLSVPPSPPGSPRSSTNTKIARFLELKTQGVHFNTKLASSSALKNPALLRNLMSFAGIDEVHGQYASSLSDELAPIPVEGFPKWAYADELLKSQDQISKRKELEKVVGKREAVDFVAASTVSSSFGTPQSSTRDSTKGSAAERVMAGLDREKSRSPQVVDGGARRSRFDDRGGRRRSRSRSPKRRRDR